jgi:RNA-directed DNA polymerase
VVRRPSLNSGAPSWPTFGEASRRVLDHQLKLHRWARSEPERRFEDVFNLICDRATLVVAWDRVSGNKGAMTAGVDTLTRADVEDLGVHTPSWRIYGPP